MLTKLLKYLHGYVRIRVDGYSPERFLNLCNANRILLWGIETKEQSCELYVGVKDYKRLRPFARKTRTRIQLLEKHGVPFFLFRFRKRKTFFAGMLLCAALIYGLSLFIWNIHFEGNVTQSNAEILAYLETLGVEHGKLKSDIVCETIETSLRTKYPNMLWVSAEMRGTRIIIQIKENTDKDIVSKIELKDTEPASIVSEHDGTVESMIVRAGTPMVMAGDEVTAGQTLVEGYYAIKNDAGEIVRYEGVAADADILLVTTEEYRDQFSAEYETKQYTEKKRLGFKLTVFDKIYEFQTKHSFKSYETVVKNKEIHITENFYLPVSLELTWYLEYESQQNLYTKEEIKSEATKRLRNNYEIILQKGVQIIEKDVKIDLNGKLCLVRGNITLRIPVTHKLPAVVPEASAEESGEGEH